MISLWLSVVAAGVGVFIASSILHMVLPYHRTDVRKLPTDKEDIVLEALQRVAVAPGDYAVPHAGGPSGMRDPAFIAKATRGPLAFMTLAPGSAPSMGPYLGMWFVYCLVVSAVTAFLVWQIAGPGADPRLAFHYGGLIAFVSYGMALPQHSIWYRRSWATTLKSMFDGLIYGAVTGGVFAWLWPNTL
jgi:hypothetical protein